MFSKSYPPPPPPPTPHPHKTPHPHPPPPPPPPPPLQHTHTQKTPSTTSSTHDCVTPTSHCHLLVIFLKEQDPAQRAQCLVVNAALVKIGYHVGSFTLCLSKDTID